MANSSSSSAHNEERWPRRPASSPERHRARERAAADDEARTALEERAALPHLRELADRMFSRAAGAPLTDGNQVRLLIDGHANYAAWLAAIRAARRYVHLENYFIRDDEIGRAFAEALAQRARDGVAVRVVYDWLGSFGKASRGFWRELREAGVEVRVYNPPQLSNPVGWLSRDHRKTLTVDGTLGFVTGLCVGQMWLGDAEQGVAPWRDTGVEIRGPAVIEIGRAFARTWALLGAPLAEADVVGEPAAAGDALSAEANVTRAPATAEDAPSTEADVTRAPAAAGDAPSAEANVVGEPAAVGDALSAEADVVGEPAAVKDVSLRIVSSEPATTSMLRLDQLVAGIARERLWLTDAYYSGLSSYVQALRAAARDGVDVRLLVPNATDIPLLKPFSRSGYRALLEAGVRVFEWNGTMLHAKTAVADGRWARVGSTNLNIASWLGNYELDAIVEDVTFARQMEQVYLADLANSTEIVLERGHKLLAPGHPRRARGSSRRRSGSTSTVAAGAMRLGNAVGAVFSPRRVLGPVQARLTTLVGLVLCALSVLCALFPRALAFPVAFFALWGGLALLWRGVQLRRRTLSSPASRSRASRPDTASQREST